MRLRAVLVLAILAGAVGLAQRGTGTASSRAPNVDSIRESDLKADLFFFASDAMRGRLTNTQENRIAEEFLKARFERLGLAPAVPGYFQNYDLMTAAIASGNSMDVISSSGARTPVVDAVTAPPGPTGINGFYPQRFSATAKARGSVVFAGYGITAKDIDYDDYRDVSAIRGKVALVLTGEPGARDPNSPFDGVVTSHLSGLLQKAQAAQAAGAVAILFVSQAGGGPNFAAQGRNMYPAAGQGGRIPTYTIGAWMNAIKIPAANVSFELVNAWMTDAGKKWDDLAAASESAARGLATVPLNVEIEINTAVTRQPVPDRNVLAKIEGSDPVLKNEWIIISAHIDHDGATGPTSILNGADDDGSGAIGVLAIAQAYADAAKAGRRPRRSILFAEFNSEERGLLGAWAYTTQPVAPLDKIVAVLNMDMIGRNEEVPAPTGEGRGGGRFNGLDPQTAESNANAMNIIGSVRTPDLKAIIDRINAASGADKLEIKYRYDNNVSNLLRRSDHWPFIQHGIPGLWFFTGLHPDYHQVGDRPERINYPKMTKVLKLVYQTSWDLAMSNARPKLLPRK